MTTKKAPLKSGHHVMCKGLGHKWVSLTRHNNKNEALIEIGRQQAFDKASEDTINWKYNHLEVGDER
jgi:hypothetical protein